jgi:hypothetical protein
VKVIPIERMSSLATASVAEYFEAGPAGPLILVDAVSNWPALEKWSLDFFSINFGSELGIASLSFDRTRSGKATKLAAYIEHLDKPFSSMPGLWFGIDGQALAKESRIDENSVWAFNWDALGRHQSLRDDISPYPAVIPNLVATLSPDVAGVLQSISSVKFFAIYISRRNTITPLHRDFHHTIGSLVQFQSDKTVILFEPDAYALSGAIFDPERPDFEHFPQMLNATAYSATLKPGEMVIIPPDWWHYTRSHDHSITLSHNFFTHRNLSAFLRCILADMERRPDKQEMFDNIRSLLRFEAEAATRPDRPSTPSETGKSTST